MFDDLKSENRVTLIEYIKKILVELIDDPQNSSAYIQRRESASKNPVKKFALHEDSEEGLSPWLRENQIKEDMGKDWKEKYEWVRDFANQLRKNVDDTTQDDIDKSIITLSSTITNAAESYRRTFLKNPGSSDELSSLLDSFAGLLNPSKINFKQAKTVAEIDTLLTQSPSSISADTRKYMEFISNMFRINLCLELQILRDRKLLITADKLLSSDACIKLNDAINKIMPGLMSNLGADDQTKSRCLSDSLAALRSVMDEINEFINTRQPDSKTQTFLDNLSVFMQGYDKHREQPRAN